MGTKQHLTIKEREEYKCEYLMYKHIYDKMFKEQENRYYGGIEKGMSFKQLTKECILFIDTQEGHVICNPISSPCLRFSAEPLKAYGDDFLQTMPKWKEKRLSEGRHVQ